MCSQLSVMPSLITLREIHVRPALFLDRDGVLLKVEKGKYVLSEADIRWLPGALNAVTRLAVLDIPIVVVTNQQCVGKGLIDNDGVEAIHTQMNEHALYSISAFYYCPHREEDNCHCRKPRVGLFETAMRNLVIDPYKSLMVGDTESDMVAAIDAGISPICIGDTPLPSIAMFGSLLQAVPFIEEWFAGVFE